MKRQPSTSIPELPAPPRRKRGLSAEERALWESVAKQTKPLRKRPRAAKTPADSPAADTPVAAKSAASPSPLPPARILRAAKPEVPSPPPPLAPIGRRERSQLSRGRKEIDARLDLHGMTQTRAHRALFGFLQRAHGDGLTFVLVITGKGKMGAESERGVLRRQVPQWLSLPEFRSLVVGFEEAHIGHGGEGALYVRIRRGKI
jgi:DNA-nicking Smr family endonuclease